MKKMLAVVGLVLLTSVEAAQARSDDLATRFVGGPKSFTIQNNTAYPIYTKVVDRNDETPEGIAIKLAPTEPGSSTSFTYNAGTYIGNLSVKVLAKKCIDDTCTTITIKKPYGQNSVVTEEDITNASITDTDLVEAAK